MGRAGFEGGLLAKVALLLGFFWSCHLPVGQEGRKCSGRRSPPPRRLVTTGMRPLTLCPSHGSSRLCEEWSPRPQLLQQTPRGPLTRPSLSSSGLGSHYPPPHPPTPSPPSKGSGERPLSAGTRALAQCRCQRSRRIERQAVPQAHHFLRRAGRQMRPDSRGARHPL